jgi:tRNA(Arg) A34 adenosine deaminase TadA
MTPDLSPFDHEQLLRSIALAGIAGARGDRPFGAVLVAADGTPLAEGLNGATTTGDLRAHAELDAITNATDRGHAARIPGATVYASGEPCPMCAAGMVWAGIGRIVFAAAAADFTPLIPGGPSFTLGCADIVHHSTEPVQVVGPFPVRGALDVFGA